MTKNWDLCFFYLLANDEVDFLEFDSDNGYGNNELTSTSRKNWL